MGNIVPIVGTQPPAIPREVSVSLTKADRDLIKAYAQGGTFAEIGARYAAMRGAKPYRNDHSAAATITSRLKQVRKKIDAIGGAELFWEMLGLGAFEIARVLREGMNATMVRPMVVRDSVVVQVTNLKGQTFDRVVTQERIVDAGPYIDHDARREAARLAATLRGDIKKAQPELAPSEEQKAPIFVFNIGGQVQVNRP